MSKRFVRQISEKIDKIVNSLQNRITGDILDTEVVKVLPDEKSKLKKSDWLFDWRRELGMNDREVYKLVILRNPSIIQGLISTSDLGDHVFVNLLENARFNRGKEKVYVGVPGNLFAFACQLSFDKGYEGNIAFDAKTKLIRHYEETIGAVHFKAQRMFIDGHAALKLISKYTR